MIWIMASVTGERVSTYLEHGEIKWRGSDKVLCQVGKVVQLPIREFSYQLEMILNTELDRHLQTHTHQMSLVHQRPSASHPRDDSNEVIFLPLESSYFPEPAWCFPSENPAESGHSSREECQLNTNKSVLYWPNALSDTHTPMSKQW